MLSPLSRPVPLASLLWLILPLGQLCYAQKDDTMPPPGRCPVSGPLLPRPTNLRDSKHIQDATEKLAQSLDSAVSGDIKAGFDVKNSSFSMALVSPNDGSEQPSLLEQRDGDGKPRSGVLWEYHHHGERNVNGTEKVDGDSQYLVGSISKAISTLMLLKSGLDLQDPITKYLPGLGGNNSQIQWENITLASLPEHLAGIPANPTGAFEWYFLSDVYEAMGFPHLEDSEYPKCGISGLNEACNEDQVVENARNALPVDHPYSRPIYSQLSFTLFSLALSAHTGKNYSQLLDELVLTPLNMKNTGASPGNDERAVIPPIESHGWGTDYGLNAPGGGLYSSLNDLAIFVNSILDYSILDTPDDVRKWLLPRSTTSAPSTIVGQPWEIQRATNLDPEHPHTIDIVSKNGGAQGYVARVSAINEYGIGVVLLTAGPMDSMANNILNEAALSSLVPAIEKETRDQAQIYVGEFNSTTSKDEKDEKAAPVSMKTSMDKGPGLKLDSLTRNGTEILEAYPKIWSFILPMTGALNPKFRMYPAGIENPVPGKDHLVREDWRISFDVITTEQQVSELPGQGSLADFCASWQTTDWLYYGNESIDKIVFTVDKRAGEVVDVEIPFLRSGLLEKV